MLLNILFTLTILTLFRYFDDRSGVYVSQTESESGQHCDSCSSQSGWPHHYLHSGIRGLLLPRDNRGAVLRPDWLHSVHRGHYPSLDASLSSKPLSQWRHQTKLGSYHFRWSKHAVLIWPLDFFFVFFLSYCSIAAVSLSRLLFRRSPFYD